MKFTFSWLRDHLETERSLDEIVERLSLIGLEVEKVEDFSRELAPFRAARVREARPHPNADRLRVCEVESETGIHQVVCGAPNARAGMVGVFAPVGTYVPGTALDLKPAKIRGVDSSGMLVSERELGLSDEHDGIIELPEGTPVGTPVASVLGLDDPMIEIAITPNRPDCLGVVGIARDLAAAGLGIFRPRPVESVSGRFANSIPIRLDFAPEGASACPVFAGRLVRGVRNGESPDWLQRRLRAVGLRPINALVDVTNYISFDRGRPLHVYDAARIKGAIGARLAAPGERLRALDGRDYLLDPEVCVIADEAGVLGLGGVMGGEASGSTEETTDVFIESAYFDPIRTAMTGRRLGIQSDARYRFERGVDPAFVIGGLELATRMILDLCGGEAGEVEVAGAEPVRHRTVSFDPGLVRSLTGVEMSPDGALRILDALGFADEGRLPSGTHRIAVPSWRPDIGGAADLVEEVTRIHGLDKVPATPLPRPPGIAGRVLSTRQIRQRTARRLLALRGYDEAVTWSFIAPAEAEPFVGADAPPALDNPISADLAVMRPSVLPGLAAAARRNQARGERSVRLFEVGPAFGSTQAEGQTLVAAALVAGPAPRSWVGGTGTPPALLAKADALAVLEAIGAPLASAQIVPEAAHWYHPGRAGSVRLGRTVLARFGELHPSTIERFELQGPVSAIEILLDALPEPKRRASRARPPLAASDLMPVERDFAFVLDAGVPAGDVVRAAQGADKALITAVTVFDVYEGPHVGEGRKSLAIAVTLQPKERTLTDEEIQAVAAKIVANVEKATGGTLRA